MAASSSLPDSRRLSALSESRRPTFSTARWNRPSSSSTESSGMLFRSGSGSPPTWAKTGPTVTPSEAPTPVSLAASPNSVLVLRDKLREGVNGLLGVLALRADDYLLTLLGEACHLHHALGVDLAVALNRYDLRREPLRRLDELRRRPAVDALFGSDCCLLLRHEALLSHREPTHRGLQAPATFQSNRTPSQTASLRKNPVRRRE